MAGPVRGRGDLFLLKASPLPSPGKTLGLWGTSLVTEEAGRKGGPVWLVISKGRGHVRACLLSPQEGDGCG